MDPNAKYRHPNSKLSLNGNQQEPRKMETPKRQLTKSLSLNGKHHGDMEATSLRATQSTDDHRNGEVLTHIENGSRTPVHEETAPGVDSAEQPQPSGHQQLEDSTRSRSRSSGRESQLNPEAEYFDPLSHTKSRRRIAIALINSKPLIRSKGTIKHNWKYVYEGQINCKKCPRLTRSGGHFCACCNNYLCWGCWERRPISPGESSPKAVVPAFSFPSSGNSNTIHEWDYVCKDEFDCKGCRLSNCPGAYVCACCKDLVCPSCWRLRGPSQSSRRPAMDPEVRRQSPDRKRTRKTERGRSRTQYLDGWQIVFPQEEA